MPAIIMVENAHKSLEHFRDEQGRDPDGRERAEVIMRAAQSVGRPLFFSLLVITVSFIPVFRWKRRRDGSSGPWRLRRPFLCSLPRCWA